jgi:hypothetical protein
MLASSINWFSDNEPSGEPIGYQSGLPKTVRIETLKSDQLFVHIHFVSIQEELWQPLSF